MDNVGRAQNWALATSTVCVACTSLKVVEECSIGSVEWFVSNDDWPGIDMWMVYIRWNFDALLA